MEIMGGDLDGRDSWEADVARPLAFGMQALHLARDERISHPNSLASLTELLDLVKLHAK